MQRRRTHLRFQTNIWCIRLFWVGQAKRFSLSIMLDMVCTVLKERGNTMLAHRTFYSAFSVCLGSCVCMISTIFDVEIFRFLLLFVGFCWLQCSTSLGHRQQSFLVWCFQSLSCLCWTAAFYASRFSWSKTVSTSPQSEYQNACPLDLCAWR